MKAQWYTCQGAWDVSGVPACCFLSSDLGHFLIQSLPSLSSLSLLSPLLSFPDYLLCQGLHMLIFTNHFSWFTQLMIQPGCGWKVWRGKQFYVITVLHILVACFQPHFNLWKIKIHKVVKETNLKQNDKVGQRGFSVFFILFIFPLAAFPAPGPYFLWPSPFLFYSCFLLGFCPLLRLIWGN